MSESNKVYSVDEKQQLEFIRPVDNSTKKLPNREMIEKSTGLSTTARFWKLAPNLKIR